MFEVGKVVITKSAEEEINQNDIWGAVRRYVNCDWGNLQEDDKISNEVAIKEDKRILAKYISTNNKEFYIITEQDRSHTTVLLTSEY